jgi:hypothetical protein
MYSELCVLGLESFQVYLSCQQQNLLHNSRIESWKHVNIVMYFIDVF